ncbi:hypothetical protein THAOC_31903, partial [Thalassiosira oceanica]
MQLCIADADEAVSHAAAPALRFGDRITFFIRHSTSKGQTSVPLVARGTPFELGSGGPTYKQARGVYEQDPSSIVPWLSVDAPMVVGGPVERIKYRLSKSCFLRPFLCPLFDDRRLGHNKSEIVSTRTKEKGGTQVGYLCLAGILGSRWRRISLINHKLRSQLQSESISAPKLLLCSTKMIVASKYLPFILVFSLSDVAAAKDPALGQLRGQSRHLPGNGNGIGSVKLKKIKKLKKLDAQGCTILEKASLCFQPTKNGKPRPCVEEP